MLAPLSHAVLKAKQRALRETMGLRVHRSISWIGRIEAAEDDGARFVFLWLRIAVATRPVDFHKAAGGAGGGGRARARPRAAFGLAVVGAGVKNGWMS